MRIMIYNVFERSLQEFSSVLLGSACQSVGFGVMGLTEMGLGKACS